MTAILCSLQVLCVHNKSRCLPAAALYSLFFDLEMLIPWDPVVPLEQERLDARGQLHVKIEEVDRECDHEERETCGHDIQ